MPSRECHCFCVLEKWEWGACGLHWGSIALVCSHPILHWACLSLVPSFLCKSKGRGTLLVKSHWSNRYWLLTALSVTTRQQPTLWQLKNTSWVVIFSKWSLSEAAVFKILAEMCLATVVNYEVLQACKKTLYEVQRTFFFLMELFIPNFHTPMLHTHTHTPNVQTYLDKFYGHDMTVSDSFIV